MSVMADYALVIAGGTVHIQSFLTIAGREAHGLIDIGELTWIVAPNLSVDLGAVGNAWAHTG